MATTVPSIACLGVIGRNNNPLHISIFPSYEPSGPNTPAAPLRTPLQFSLLLSSTLDVFELRARAAAQQDGGGATRLSGDLGLLHAVDDRLAAYGFETNTGVKMVAIVDRRGRSTRALTGSAAGAGGGAGMGLREGEVKPVFKAMQAAYIQLLQNPFFDPDEHSPPGGRGGHRITSKKFGEAMRRIGENWAPGVTSL